MVFLKVTYHTFHDWRHTSKIGGRLNSRSIGPYLAMCLYSLCLKPRFSSKVKVRRTIVVLKSPFHYKTPKHHIQYKFFTTSLSLRVRGRFINQVREALSGFFTQQRANRVSTRTNRNLDLLRLL